MPRDYEIMIAFRQTVKRDAAGRYTISTLDFVKELDRLNWRYSLRAADKWIEMHTTTFRDISMQEGERECSRYSIQMVECSIIRILRYIYSDKDGRSDHKNNLNQRIHFTPVQTSKICTNITLQALLFIDKNSENFKLIHHFYFFNPSISGCRVVVKSQNLYKDYTF